MIPSMDEWVTSERLRKFSLVVEQEVRRILSCEMSVRVQKRYFLYQKQYHPIKVRFFQHGSRLGHFDPNHLEIGVNMGYLDLEWEELQNLLRHELLHYIAYIELQDPLHQHVGPYRDLARRYGYGKQVYAAHAKIEMPSKKKASIGAKVEKLLALSSSSNPHEAKSATHKAQELLLKYNLGQTKKEELWIVKRIFPQKRLSAKYEAIAHILTSLFVKPIFSYRKKGVDLEIFGRSYNVEVAVAIAYFLEAEFDRRWSDFRLQNPKLKGLRAKNSFFKGMSQGYIHQGLLSSEQSGLILKDVESAVNLAYPRLSKVGGGQRVDSKSFKGGQKAGQSLTIRSMLREKLRLKGLLE